MQQCCSLLLLLASALLVSATVDRRPQTAIQPLAFLESTTRVFGVGDPTDVGVCRPVGEEAATTMTIDVQLDSCAVLFETCPGVYLR